MDFLSSSELTIPAAQMAMLLMLTTVTLLLGRIRLALMITYLFTLYWGYFLNRAYMFKAVSGSINNFTWIYFGFGLLVVFFALAGFLRPGRN